MIYNYYEFVEIRLAFLQCQDCLEIIETAKLPDDLPEPDRCPECGGFHIETGFDYFQE